jgi:uncharacterized membrane protein
MRTHTKEAVATIVAFVALISVIHAGIWFTIFGTPGFTVLGFPFHYFWLVAGGPVAMFVLYAVYYRYITTAIMDEKKQLKADASEMSTDPSEIDG